MAYLAFAAALSMSLGAVTTSRIADPLPAVLAYGAALAFVLAAALRPSRPAGPWAVRAGFVALGLAAVVVVMDRRELVQSATLVADDALAAATLVAALLAAAWPRGPRLLRPAVYGLALATYLMAGAILIHAKPYHSDAVVAAHGGAELLLAGRHPYADFDMHEQLPRFGLTTDWSTDLEDGSELRSLNYPALAVLVPVPAIAAGITDLRIVYLAEVLVILALVTFSAADPWRAFALATGLATTAVMRQFVVAGIDPTWALFILLAWLTRRRRLSSIAIGLAIAARQTAWLVAPFLVAWSWRRHGPREALARAGTAAVIALGIHAPFFVADPAAVIGGPTDIIVLPLVRAGVGPSMLLGDAISRPIYLAAASAALAVVALVWWRRTARPAASDRATVVVPLTPLWLASRALQSYFALLPLLLFVEEGRETEAEP